MDITYLHLAIKLIVGFISLFLVTRILGGRELNQLTVFDFISAIVLSELVGNVLYSNDADVGHMLFSIALWALFIYSIDKITLYSRKARALLDGSPAHVIVDGKINKQLLKKFNTDMNELLSLLRQQGVFSLSEVKHAFLETNGSISILKNSSSNPDLPLPLIIDGKILSKNVKLSGKDEAWLWLQLEQQGIQDPSQVIYAELNKGESLYVSHEEKNKSLETF